MQRTNPSRLQTGLRRLRLDWVLYALLLPTLVYFVIFRVIPIWNMRLAFYNFSGRSAWTWAGLKYFEMMFGSPLMKDILLNTLIISLMKYVLLFPFFPLFAILLSEMRLGRLRKFTQVVSYLPHFLSWVVIAGIWISFLAKTGAVNQIRGLFGLTPIDYMTDKGSIRWVLFFSEGWRSLGWDSIIYFTTILGISPSLYEAADIDGATRFQMVRYIVLPALVTPMVTMLSSTWAFSSTPALTRCSTLPMRRSTAPSKFWIPTSTASASVRGSTRWPRRWDWSRACSA